MFFVLIDIKFYIMARDNLNSPYFEDNGEGTATYNKVSVRFR